MAKQEFQTEVNQLLQLIIHSLYSHPEIFLRELISNSSDALDKLRHLTLTDDAFKSVPFEPRIDLALDEEAKTLTISDTGIGMNEEDLTQHLGTIARSGTKNFLSQLSGDARKDSNLIGQFGVGFYSAFMVADKHRSHDAQSRRRTGLQAGSQRRQNRLRHRARRHAATEPGTTVLLHLNDEGKQYANGWRLQEIVKKYSNHIAFPIFLTYDRSPSGTPRKRNPTKKFASPSRSTLPPPSGAAPNPSSPTTTTRSSTSPSPATPQDPLYWFHTKRRRLASSTPPFSSFPPTPRSTFTRPTIKAGVKLYVKPRLHPRRLQRPFARSTSASSAASSIAKTSRSTSAASSSSRTRS